MEIMFYILVGVAIVLALVGVAYVGYLLLTKGGPSPEQLENVREWLIYAVTKAEISLGGGTGALKLRQVYDMFADRFPSIAQYVAFSTFSKMVDDALVVMREMLEKNKNVRDLVEKKEEA